MMLGVKLQGAERWKAWGTVMLFTFLAIMQTMGTFMPAYFYEKVGASFLHATPRRHAGRRRERPDAKRAQAALARDAGPQAGLVGRVTRGCKAQWH